VTDSSTEESADCQELKRRIVTDHKSDIGGVLEEEVLNSEVRGTSPEPSAPKRKGRRKGGIMSDNLPGNPRAADLAARHEVMLLLQDHPQLWPQLYNMTLHQPVDWPSVLATLLSLVSTTMTTVATLTSIAA